jgi:hypothetical protein
MKWIIDYNDKDAKLNPYFDYSVTMLNVGYLCKDTSNHIAVDGL